MLDIMSVEPLLDAGKTLFTIEQHFGVDTPLGTRLFQAHTSVLCNHIDALRGVIDARR
jgi:hypothetical protein